MLNRTVPIATCLVVLLTAALMPGCAPVAPTSPFSEEEWKDLNEGRLASGVQALALTVIDLAEDERGKQVIAFDLDVGKDSEHALLPCSTERSVTDTVNGVGRQHRTKEDTAKSFALFVAKVRYVATAGEGERRAKCLGLMNLVVWPGIQSEGFAAKPPGPSRAEFRNVRLERGVLHGELVVDKAGIVADINKGLAGDTEATRGLRWQVCAILTISVDNRLLRHAFPENDRFIFVHASGSVRNWAVWAWPE